MIKEESFGIIPILKNEKNYLVFLIHHRNGDHWGFPKGHADGDEKEIDIAKRELFEETNLEVENFISKEPLIEKYHCIKNNMQVDKTVKYYIAKVKDKNFKLQQEEIIDGKWVTFEEAKEIISFFQSKEILEKAYKIVVEGNL